MQAGMTIWCVCCDNPDDYLELAKAYIQSKGYTQAQVKIVKRKEELSIVSKCEL